MTTAELKTALDEAGVNPCAYSLEGGLPNEAYTLSRESDGGWATYYSERGLRTNLQHFTTESDACEDLLARVLRDSGARWKGTW